MFVRASIYDVLTQVFMIALGDILEILDFIFVLALGFYLLSESECIVERLSIRSFNSYSAKMSSRPSQ